MNNPHIVQDRFERVVGKADDIAAENNRAGAFPIKQHLPVFSNLVLILARAAKIFWVDVLQADENSLDPGASRLINKVRNSMATRINLNAALKV